MQDSQVLTSLTYLKCIDSTVELVFQNSPNSVNSQDSKGSTPLHLAAMLSRLDVVTLFLSSDIVDDTIKDINGRTCLDLAGNSDIAGAISSKIFVSYFLMFLFDILPVSLT